MIALIPARGRSRGLVNKNIKLLNGKPMIAYTIEAALKSNDMREVFVSTDSPEIAKIAKEYGAQVPELRPKNLASDRAMAIDTYIYMLDLWEGLGREVLNFIVLQPTSPLRNELHINDAVELFNKTKADSVVSYTKEDHPISWHKHVAEDLTFELLFQENIENRQKNRATYYPNGAIYIFTSDLIRQRKYYSKKSYCYIMDRLDSVDVDTIDDFEYVSYLIEKNNKNVKV